MRTHTLTAKGIPVAVTGPETPVSLQCYESDGSTSEPIILDLFGAAAMLAGGITSDDGHAAPEGEGVDLGVLEFDDAMIVRIGPVELTRDQIGELLAAGVRGALVAAIDAAERSMAADEGSGAP